MQSARYANDVLTRIRRLRVWRILAVMAAQRPKQADSDGSGSTVAVGYAQGRPENRGYDYCANCARGSPALNSHARVR